MKLIPDTHPGVMEAKWAATRFTPFLASFFEPVVQRGALLSRYSVAGDGPCAGPRTFGILSPSRCTRGTHPPSRSTGLDRVSKMQWNEGIYYAGHISLCTAVQVRFGPVSEPAIQFEKDLFRSMFGLSNEHDQEN